MKPLLISSLFIYMSFVLKAQDIYFPPLIGATWETKSPAELDWCEEQIDVLYDYLESESTKSFILLRDGRIVLEKYFGTYTKDSVWFWFSAGKSLTAVLTGIAQEQNMLDINDPTSNYLGSGWTSLTIAQEERITIENQLTMTSGLDETDFSCTDPECLTYLANSGDRWVYHNAPYSLLRNVIEEASGQEYGDFTKTYITNKSGLAGSWVKSGFNNFFVSRARDMARFGLLVMNEGMWDTTPVLSDPDYISAMTQPSQDLNPSYGYLWWLNGQSKHIGPDSSEAVDGPIAPDAPSDIYTAAGFQGQFISISPSQKLVMIRQGTDGGQDKAALPLLNEIWARIGQLECTITSLEESAGSDKIRPYPNPASEYIKIPDLYLLDPKVEVFDTSGQTQNVTFIDGRLDIRLLRPGLYTLRITTSSEIKLMKFQKL